MKQAINGSNSDQQYKVMSDEMKSILKTKVIVDKPKHEELFGCRMVLLNNYICDGNLQKRKARLVTQG